MTSLSLNGHTLIAGTEDNEIHEIFLGTAEQFNTSSSHGIAGAVPIMTNPTFQRHEAKGNGHEARGNGHEARGKRRVSSNTKTSSEEERYNSNRKSEERQARMGINTSHRRRRGSTGSTGAGTSADSCAGTSAGTSGNRAVIRSSSSFNLVNELRLGKYLLYNTIQ